MARRRHARDRVGSILSVELLLLLPILLIVVFAVVQFSLTLMALQAISASAHAGVREAALPGSSRASVVATVHSALTGWRFQDDVDVQIFVNGQPEKSASLTHALTDDEVSITVRVPATEAAPDALLLAGISLNSTNLQSTFVMRKE